MQRVISTRRVGGMTLEFGQVGSMFYVSRRKGYMTKARVRLFNTRAAAVAFGRQIAERLSKPVKVLANVRHFGQIIRSGALYFVKLNRRDYWKQPVKGFTSKEAAFNYFNEQRTLSSEGMERELEVAEKYRFRAA